MRVRWNTFGMNLLRESDVKRKIELNQVKRQIEILSTFMPDEILNIPLNELEDPHTFVGVLLFADVSGFTPLCEKYNKTGKGGIYRLTATLNAYIGALVEVITFYGGDILKFSGDAFLALWKAPIELRLYEVIHQVIVCALFIQNTLGRFETEVNVLLKVKLAIACGNLTFCVIGNQEHRHYIIVGQAINDVKAAEHASTSGDVVVAPSAWGHLSEDNYEVTFGENGNIKVWNCVYFPNQYALKEEYATKYAIAHILCVKHLEHRSQIHEKRRIDDVTTDSKLTESFISSLPERAAVNDSSSRWIPNDLNPFIVRPVQSQVHEKQPIEYLTEMRQVTIQFINIVSTTYQDIKLVPMVNKAYQTICKIVSQLRGVVNKVSLFDKDCMFLVLFGLRGIEHELESQNALKSAFAIRKLIKRLSTVKSISIGITNGWVYCGVVGHPFRREYTVIGGAVNKAARIMCAYEDKVTCDHDTYKSCKLSSLYFQLQSARQLKGIADAGLIFEYNEDFDKMSDDEQAEMPLIGRGLEMQAAEAILKYPEITGFGNVCFKGENKIGKSKLLQTVHKKYMDSSKFICSMVLNEALERNYYCVSTLYQQLYNIMSEVNPKILKVLPRDLWDWTELMQQRSSKSLLSLTNLHHHEDVKNNIHKNFLKMCKATGESVIFYIDNIQFIDNNSFELLEIVLEKKYARLISAGCFEESATWGTMWKISLSPQIKMFTLKPLLSTDLAVLMCNFLNVKGISKKLLVLIYKTCEGRPGWVQACLLKMINNGELEVKYAGNREEEYAFLEGIYDESIVLVAGISKKYLERSEETSTAITLDLFDSFSAYQQLIIKTAAVLGEIFTRSSLIVLLKYPNENILATAIRTLYEEEIFDCASRYVNSGGLQERRNICLCFMEDDEYDEENELGLPKYAFCKVLHFKSRNIRLLAYDLLPLNQKKELHLRITDLLEKQNNSCPACLRDNSTSIITIRRFKDLLKYCNDQKYIWTSEFSEVEDHSIEVYKDIIRNFIHNPEAQSENWTKRDHFTEVPRRKAWDPTVCFCLEILMKVYKDLVHHSHCAQHLGKKIFFMVEYAMILFHLQDLEEAIPILNEASELCMVQTNKAYIFTGNFKTLMMGKIHWLLGNIYLRLGNIEAAKNQAIISLRQYNVPLISFKYTFPHMLVNKSCFMRFNHIFNTFTRQDNPLIKLDFGLCMCLISNIYAAEGCWELAKLAAARSVICLKHSNPNIEVLCDIFTNAGFLYSFCGDMHLCEELERCFHRKNLQYYSNYIISELVAISRVLTTIFMVRVLSGHVTEAIQLGYRCVYLQMNIQAHYLMVEFIPILAYVLLFQKRIDESAYLAGVLFNIGKKFNVQGYLAYYSFCSDLILRGNFYIEPMEKIHEFAVLYFDQKNRYNNHANHLILNLYNYYLRNRDRRYQYWKKLYNNEESKERILALIDVARYTECLLLELAMNKQNKKKHLQSDIDETKMYLNTLKRVSKKWPLVKSKYFHFKAYYYRLMDSTSKAAKFLKRSRKWAVKQGNIMEECWINLHSSYWFGGYPLESITIQPLDWKLAKTYTPMQWSLIMFPLPYY